MKVSLISTLTHQTGQDRHYCTYYILICKIFYEVSEGDMLAHEHTLHLTVRSNSLINQFSYV